MLVDLILLSCDYSLSRGFNLYTRVGKKNKKQIFLVKENNYSNQRLAKNTSCFLSLKWLVNLKPPSSWRDTVSSFFFFFVISFFFSVTLLLQFTLYYRPEIRESQWEAHFLFQGNDSMTVEKSKAPNTWPQHLSIQLRCEVKCASFDPKQKRLSFALIYPFLVQEIVNQRVAFFF